MTESKTKRLIVAVTAGAVLLLAILLCVLIYQLISIRIESKKLDELREQVAVYRQLTDEEKQTLEARKQEWWLIRRAYELGYTFEDDMLLKK